jgi:haloalkane dehalogenase
MESAIKPISISADFPWESKYVQVFGWPMHYIDEGSGDPILFLHGNPTSSYLYRNIIPYLIPTARCIVPDLIGCGKSGKPDIEYRMVDHTKFLEEFIRILDLKNLTIVGHDWGSYLEFYYAMRNEENLKGIAFMEAFLATMPGWNAFPPAILPLFKQIRTPGVGWDLIGNQNLFIEHLLPAQIVRPLSPPEMNYYRERHTEPQSRRPFWRWPNEIPIAGQPADVHQAITEYNEWLQKTPVPKLLLWATPGQLTPKAMVEWCEANMSNLETVHVGTGIHYIQEDQPHAIGAALAEWYTRL